MKAHTKRFYLFNRINKIDTVVYIQEATLTNMSQEISNFKQLMPYLTQPAQKAAYKRLDATEHQAPYIEVTPKHHTLMGWEANR